MASINHQQGSSSTEFRPKQPLVGLLASSLCAHLTCPCARAPADVMQPKGMLPGGLLGCTHASNEADDGALC